MDHARWNALTNKARDGKLDKNEQLEVVRAIAQMKEGWNETKALLAGAVIEHGRNTPNIPDGTHKELYIGDKALTRAKQASAEPTAVYTPQMRGYKVSMIAGVD